MPTIGQGLNIAGAALAQALMQRKARRDRENRISDLINALQPQAFPEEDIPGFDQSAGLATALLPPEIGGPMKTAMTGVKEGALGIQNQAAVEQNRKRDLMKTLLMTGSPQAEQMAYQIGGLGQQSLQGAERYMNLGGGKVLDMTTEKVMDFADTPYADPDKRFKTIESGGRKIVLDMMPTMEGGNPAIAWQGEPEQKVEFEAVGAPGDRQQKMAYTIENGKVVSQEALGEPYSGAQRVIQTNIDAPPLSGDAPFLRKAQADIATAYGAVQRIERIEEVFEPFFQSAPGKVATWSLEMFDRMLPAGLPAGKGKDLLSRKTSFAQYTNENVNRYIKMITGAQMSEAEATRLSKAIANLGDSPTQFAVKLANSKKVMEEAARILEEELQFYAGVEGMDYEEALKYAQKKAANHIRLGLSDIESQAGEYDAVFGGKGGGGSETPAGFTPAPQGYRYRQIDNKTWELVKE